MENRNYGLTAVEADMLNTRFTTATAKIGKVDNLFVDENDQPEYIGVFWDQTLLGAQMPETGLGRGCTKVGSRYGRGMWGMRPATLWDRR